MARTFLVSELLDKLRWRGGYERSARLTDTKLIDFLESGVAELHDLLVSKYGDAYMRKRTSGLTLTIDQEEYALPADLLKLLAVDVKVGGRWRRVERYQLVERNLVQDSGGLVGWWGTGPYVYTFEGDNIRFQPPPKAADEYRLIYIKAPPKLSGPTDTVEGYSGWEELIVAYALRKARDSQGEPLGSVERDITRLEKRVEWAADGRDASEPLTIQDVNTLDDAGWGV